MKHMKSILAAFTLALATMFTVSPAAYAQGTIVVVIDEGRILAESKAGKDMFTKLKNIENQINAELKPTRDSLETERQALAGKLQGKTREAIVADAALVKQIEDFQKKTNDFAQKRNTVSQEYAATEQKAFLDFNTALEPALLDVVKEKNAQVVLSKNQAVFTADAIDVSANIVTKLDAKTPAINVVRQRAPAPQK
ncbi:MAG: OmpH family outer membrane protein [Hyphomonas sp.]|uniref:OmpH family outer membrane protein n=1 Tax=Hyphomonas sp. TaxID=87 RepID=UPI0017967EB8|nr:OmpH family outer membrane protein [Hyphomonas sp.]MBA3069672.1 OmpH family outer membrane protein [Hyphomonas sp.]MBU3920513.1 OmpH family outer membrane protein [Alphaproteobacteria bacterium]MBU4062513.1 OmpH family outer membrane protein [Alphaproteobacteria bacterium]MBU4163864.1 OmpH family outer membrane protein [Alphaproteobacteria bacterium]